MTPLDGLIILAFVAWSVATGLACGRRASRGLDEYFLAGRSLGGWSAGASMAATQFAADTPLLVTGLIATGGIFALWQLWIYAVAFLLMGFVLAPGWRRAGVLTDAELSELRYGGRPAALLRGVKAVWFGTVFNCVVLAMVLLAARTITAPFLHWDAWLPAAWFETFRTLATASGIAGSGDTAASTAATNDALSLGAIIGMTLLYSTTGGLRAVVRTDVVQLVIMLVATAAYAWVVVDAAGGLAGLNAGLLAGFPDGGDGPVPGVSQLLAFTPSRARDASAAVLTLFALQWLLQINADGTGYLAQRSMACRSDADATRAAVVFTVLQVVVRSLLWLPIGLGLLLLFPPGTDAVTANLAADREATFVRGMAELLPPGLLGLMLAGMLAALASTVDTHLNWGASYWTNDLYRRFLYRGWLRREPDDRSLVRVARLANVLILAIALLVMGQLASIQAAWQASLLLGAGLGAVLVLRWLWWRMNAWGELAAIVAAAVAAVVVMAWLPPDQAAVRLLVVGLLATAAGIGTALATPAEDAARLEDFYRRARPPGFWDPVARACSHDPAADRRRLARGLAATITAATAVFALLVGGGTFLVSGTPPAWLPYRDVWAGGLLAVAVAAGALSWRLVRNGLPAGPPGGRGGGTPG